MGCSPLALAAWHLKLRQPPETVCALNAHLLASPIQINIDMPTAEVGMLHVHFDQTTRARVSACGT